MSRLVILVRTVFVFVAIVSTSAFSMAQKYWVLSDTIQDRRTSPYEYLRCIETPKVENWRVQDVLGHDDWGKTSYKELSIKRGNVDYWCRIHIDRNFDDVPYVLEFPDSHIDELEVWARYNGDLRKLGESGDLNVHDKRAFNHKNFVYFLPKDFQRGEIIYRAHGRHTAALQLWIRRTDDFLGYAFKEYYTLGIYYGVFLLVVIVNLLFGLITKEKVAYLGAAYCCGLISMSLVKDGTGFQYIWPNLPNINHLSFALSVFLTGLFQLKFAFEFLKLGKTVAGIRSWYKIGVATRIVWSFVGIVIFPHWKGLLAVDASWVFLCLWMGYKSYRHSPGFMKWYLVAFVWMFVGYVMYGIYLLNWIAPTVLSVYAINIASVGHMIFLMVAVLARTLELNMQKAKTHAAVIEVKDEEINELKETINLKYSVNRNLEDVAQERAIEVVKKNQELASVNEKLREQAKELDELNRLLDIDNFKLKRDVRNIATARVMQENVEYTEFRVVYPDKESCYRLLEELKWEEGFACKKCSNQKFAKGAGYLARRCTKCGYNESVTNGTIFKGIKLDIDKAFYMAFTVYSSNAKVSASELAEKLDLSVKACSAFKRRIVEAREIRPVTESWVDLLIV